MQYLLLDGTTFLPNIACIDYLVTCHVSAVGRMIHERSRRSKRTIKEEKRVEKGSYFPADDNMHYHMYLYGLFPSLIMNIYCSYLPFFIISFFFKVKLWKTGIQSVPYKQYKHRLCGKYAYLFYIFMHYNQQKLITCCLSWPYCQIWQNNDNFPCSQFRLLLFKPQ